MATAQLVKFRATCDRLHVGVVIARDARIISTGYNGAPRGMKHCDHKCTCKGPVELNGELQHWDSCDMNHPCRLSVHAEVNAIAYAAKAGVSTFGAEMFTTNAPCYACAQLIINAGIMQVWYAEPFRDMSGIELLHMAKIQVSQTT